MGGEENIDDQQLVSGERWVQGNFGWDNRSPNAGTGRPDIINRTLAPKVHSAKKDASGALRRTGSSFSRVDHQDTGALAIFILLISLS